jgi:hypothetical protein
MTEALRAYDRTIIPIEFRFEQEMAREKNRYMSEAIRQLDNMGRISNDVFQLHRSMVGVIIKKYGDRAIVSYGAVIAKSVADQFKQQKNTDFEDAMAVQQDVRFWDRLMSSWFTQFAADKVTGIALTTQEDLNRLITQTVDFTPAERVQAIEKVEGINRNRARTIARTEAHSAAMFASVEVTKKIAQETESEVLKAWLPVQDERTRLSHAAMASVEPIPMDADFIVNGEKMARPSDPRGSAGNVINCRCVLTYEVE